MVVGDEGLLGRGGQVIISNNILYDAGCSEGMIYAKGSDYIKVVNNIVQATASNPKLALIRGIISDSVNGTASGNKFIGMPIGIVTRETNANYSDNEFYGITNICLTMRLVNGTAHESTVVDGCYADQACSGSFFYNETADGSTATYGDVIVRNNTLYTGGAAVQIKAADNFVFENNYVNRITPSGIREVIAFRANKTVDLVNIRNNRFVDFDDGSSTGRVTTILADAGTGLSTAPRFMFKDNYCGVGQYGVWGPSLSYTDFVIFGNDFFCAVPVNDTSITVSNYNVKTQNVGIDLV